MPFMGVSNANPMNSNTFAKNVKTLHWFPQIIRNVVPVKRSLKTVYSAKN